MSDTHIDISRLRTAAVLTALCNAVPKELRDQPMMTESVAERWLKKQTRFTTLDNQFLGIDFGGDCSKFDVQLYDERHGTGLAVKAIRSIQHPQHEQHQREVSERMNSHMS